MLSQRPYFIYYKVNSLKNNQFYSSEVRFHQNDKRFLMNVNKKTNKKVFKFLSQFVVKNPHRNEIIRDAKTNCIFDYSTF
jgi:hypothetical protein